MKKSERQQRHAVVQEELTKAEQGMGLVQSDLNQALSRCTCTESILLRSLIEDAANLRCRIESLQHASHVDHKE
jgi:hypothetical protein